MAFREFLLHGIRIECHSAVLKPLWNSHVAHVKLHFIDPCGDISPLYLISAPRGGREQLQH